MPAGPSSPPSIDEPVHPKIAFSEDRGRSTQVASTHRSRCTEKGGPMSGFLRLGVVLVTAMVLAAGGASSWAASGGSGGTISVLIQSRVALTPDVAAAIGAHTAHVS